MPGWHLATNPLRRYVASSAGASNSWIAEVGGQNNVPGKIEACSCRTFVATGIKDLIPLNMGDISRNAYVPSILEEGHWGRREDRR